MKMKPITILKRNVEKILKQNGYKKVKFENYDDAEKTYCYYDGCINFNIGKVFYSFGEDKIFNTLAHICVKGCDLGTNFAQDFFNTFSDHISGRITEREIEKYVTE